MDSDSFEKIRHKKEYPWSYSDLDHYQRNIADKVEKEHHSGKILLSEVAPVVTLGKRQRPFFHLSHVSVYPTDRGGLETYHGPGQWLLFPVMKVKSLSGKSGRARTVIEILLNAAKNTAQKWGKEAWVESGERLGVWNEQGKLASVGIRVQKGVILHGLALNVYPTPESFQEIRPCGLGARPSYLFYSQEQASFEKVGDSLVESLMLGRENHQDLSIGS